MVLPYIIARKYRQTHRGVSTIEYSIIGALLAIVSLTSLYTLGSKVAGGYCNTAHYIGDSIGSNGLLPCAVAAAYGTGYDGRVWPGGGISCGSICSSGAVTSIDAEMLYKINAQSPITSFYGLYDNQKQAVTSINDAYNTVNMGGSGSAGVTTSNPTSQYHYEVQTADGHSYGVFTSKDNMGYRDLQTGATYLMNNTTGVVSYIGVTSGNIDYT